VLGIHNLFGADPAPDSTPDPTPYFRDFKDAKKIHIFYLISYNLPAGTLVPISSVLKIKFFAKIL
jgi:hypothetical protein